VVEIALAVVAGIADEEETGGHAVSSHMVSEPHAVHPEPRRDAA
jgi:hypothetical protein